jgi:hypothetical protein
MAKPTEKDYEDLKWLLQRLNDSEEYCNPYFERAKRHYKLYRFGSAVENEDWPYVNRVRSRDILAFIEDSTAILMATLFAQMPFFAVIPRETSMLMLKYTGLDAKKIGEQQARCLDYQFSHEDTEFLEEITDFFKGGNIFGNAYMGVYPKFDVDGNYLRPLLKTTDFWDIMPIAGARRVSKARGIWVREWSNEEEIKRLQNQKVYRKTDTLISSGDDNNWHKELLNEIGMTGYTTEHNDGIEILHYFSGGHVITIMDRRVILRDSRKEDKPYPYDMPIVQFKAMPVPLEFFAMGVPEVLEVLQEDKNLIRSARRDNIDLVINKIIKAKSGADINFDLIKYYAGAIWPLENLTDIDVVEIGDVTQSSYQEEAMRTQDMENALSLFGYARGQTPQHAEQPTTVMKLQQASMNRLDLAIKLAEFTTLQNIAVRIILLTRKYMKKEYYEAIIGEKDAGFFQISEEDIKRFFYFKPVGSSVTNIKELRQQQTAAAFQTAMSVPPEMRSNNVNPYTLDLHELEKEMFKAVDIQGIDRILIPLPSEEEVAEYQQQEAMKQQVSSFMNNVNQLRQVPYGGNNVTGV